LLNDTAHLGIFSDGDSSTAGNGTVLHETFSINTNDAAFSGATSRFAAGHYASQSMTVTGDYILDVRPDLGTKNLDGSPDTGAGSAEVIVGTPYNDLIKAGEGDDTVYAGDGNDVVYGGGGADKLYGGNGNDYLYGGDAPDILDGGAGDDHIFGDSSGSSVNGVDQLIGGSGNDFIYGGIGIDKMFGGTGDDVMYGGTDTDPFMYGGDGNDYMNGGSGQDTLFGGNGSDIIDGGTGIDQLYGDGGDDILRPGDGVSDISGNGGGGDVLIGGDNVTDTGFDLADYSQQTAATSLVGDLTNQVVSQAVLDKLLANQNPSVFATSTIWFQLEGVIGTPSSDRLSGDSAGDASAAVSHGDNWLIGGSGNDELLGRGGNDVLIGKSIRLDTLIGTYSGTYQVAEDATGASHRITGTTLSGGILDYASGGGVTYDKHFQELLKSQAYKDYVLGDGGANGGVDQADYRGNLADYSFKLLQFQSAKEGSVAAVQVKDSVAGRDGADLDIGIDKFQFLDGTFTLAQVLTPAPQVSGANALGASSEDTSVVLKSSSLLANATGSLPISVTGLTASAGMLTLNPDGTSWTYTPPPNWNSGTFQKHGPVTFSYAVTDGVRKVADSATLSITPVNDLPTGTADVAVTGAAANNRVLTVSDSLVMPITDADYVGTGVAGTNVVPRAQLSFHWTASLDPGAATPVWTTVSNSVAGAPNLALTTQTNTLNLAGQYLRATATYTDPDGTAETVKSATYVVGDATANGTLAAPLGANDPGADIMIGLGGNDVYAVNNAGDVVTEAAGGGTDTVLASINAYALTANVENLTFTGTGDFAGTGNTLANVITGGAGNDTLDGGGGADTLVGGAGNDTYVVNNAGVTITEAAGGGTDTVRTSLTTYTLGANLENLTYTGAGKFTGTGNTDANLITGGAGNDTLSDGGGTGIDTLIGGAGNDIYNVSVAGDIITEAAGGGTDTVRTTLGSYTLGANLENLTFTGAGNFTGTGNGQANTLTGGAGNDTLDGGLNAAGGVDTLVGGAGDDTYIVRNAGDVVIEAANGGTDTVQTTLSSYTLGTNLENLTFIGTGAFIGTGNTVANVLTAGVASGQLTGGLGADTFVMSQGVANRSLTITDFSHAQADQITLSGYGLGAKLTQTSLTGAAITQYAVQSAGGATLDQFQLSNKAVLVMGDYHFA